MYIIYTYVDFIVYLSSDKGTCRRNNILVNLCIDIPPINIVKITYITLIHKY